MKIVKVKIAKKVLGNFFIERQGQCFGVTKGLPIDAEMTHFGYSQQEGVYIATFTSSEFKELGNGDTVPFIEVEYTAYQLVPKAEEAEETVHAVH